ncbi:MAG: phosphate signaling complex PhoU family protein [Desulfitobacteriaceae bacterium]
MAAVRMTGYDRALFELRSMVEQLSIAVREHLAQALATLEKANIVEDWRALDNAIDQARDWIVNRCFDIMSLQQLRSQDLRWILGYQRIARELERIADYACDLVELSELKPREDWPAEIFEMTGQLLDMFDYNVAILKGEREISTDLNQQDDVLDRAYFQLKRRLLQASRNNESGHDLGVAILVARTLERMGDHAVNVAEELLFVQTGKKRLSPSLE